MSDAKDEREIKDDSDEGKHQIKTRQKQFLEERLSVLKPKTDEEEVVSSAPKVDFAGSQLKDNFHQDLIKQYRDCQKHKIEDE